MKKLIFFLILLLTYKTEVIAQCDCGTAPAIQHFNRKKNNVINYKARWKENTDKIIHFNLVLEKNKKYVFRMSDKKGKTIDNIRVTLMNNRRIIVRENKNKKGKMIYNFSFTPLETNIFYLDISLITPKTSYCTCAYVVMCVRKE